MDQRVRMVVELERSGVPASEVVATALARANGVEAVDLDVCLFEHVDPSGLDRLFADRSSGDSRTGRISFPVAGYRVTVTHDAGEGVTARVESVGEVLDERAITERDADH